MKKSIIFFIAVFLVMISVFQLTSITPSKTYATADNSEVESLEISAKSALLMDYDTETVCYEKNANERLPIASMTKLASLAVVFDAIEKGAVKPSDIINVSENAAGVGGSSAFLDAGSSYTVEELIKTVIIVSANDSTVALAEHIAGSEEVFVSKMNKLALNLGLTDTHFENSTGLPHENHYSSAHDIAKIYKQVCNNPLYKKYAKIYMEDFIHPSGRKTGLVNTNRLVKTFEGIEGGKTGYTDKAKFCLTASARRGGSRLIGVVIGADDSKTRFAEVTKLLNFGFANYETVTAINSQIPVTVAQAQRSRENFEVYPERDSLKFVKKGSEEAFSYEFKLNEKIVAPLSSGDVVGKMLVFDKNNMVVDEINLILKKDIAREKFSDRLSDIVQAW